MLGDRVDLAHGIEATERKKPTASDRCASLNPANLNLSVDRSTLLTVPFDTCTVCGRVQIERGATHVVEAAFDRSSEQQAVRFLVAMLEGKRQRPRSNANDMLLLIEDFADTGTAEIPRQLNDLFDGIWELKAHKLRLPFYYSDAGCASVRITHGFVKNTDKTPLREIDIAKAIRREDESK